MSTAATRHTTQYNVLAALREEFPDAPPDRTRLAFDTAWHAFDERTLLLCGRSDRDRDAELRRIRREVRTAVLQAFPVGFFGLFGWLQLLRLVALIVRLVWEHKRGTDP